MPSWGTTLQFQFPSRRVLGFIWYGFRELLAFRVFFLSGFSRFTVVVTEAEISGRPLASKKIQQKA